MIITKRRIVAVLISIVLVIGSASSVFAAASSPDKGKTASGKTVASLSKKTIKVYTNGTIKYSINGKKAKTTKKKVIKGLKTGDLVTIKTKEGVSRRWMKTVTITKAKNKRVVWKKVKGASFYMIKITDKKGRSRWRATSQTSFRVPKGSKVNIRPVRKKGGKKYMGVLCKTRTVK